jgi:hypothetical protein
MAIQITRQEVLNNLIRLKNNLLLNGEKKLEPLFPKRHYPALVNRSTGEIQFANNGQAPERQWLVKERGANWQEIHFVAEDDQNTVHFHVTKATGSSFKPTELDPLAVRILFETLDVLNQLASQCELAREELPEKMVLQHLSDLQVTPVQEAIESMPGWSGSLSRLEAEKKLAGCPIGTYLLRHGNELIDEVAKAIAESNQMPIKAYVLTFVEGKQKISDRLLIQTEWGWTIACDNSDLSSPVYEYHQTLNALLYSMRDQLKIPLEAS